ncbi:MAG: hypothetical protein WDM96_19350 [Lacunisphaera sp.]
MSAPLSWRHWLEAARPKTLPAAIIPVAVGTALAVSHHAANYGRAAICLAFSLLVQIGTNFANDYFDFVQGADTVERVGPRRAVAAGLIAPATSSRQRGRCWVRLSCRFAPRAQRRLGPAADRHRQHRVRDRLHRRAVSRWGTTGSVTFLSSSSSALWR